MNSSSPASGVRASSPAPLVLGMFCNALVCMAVWLCSPPDVPGLTWGNFLWMNLVPVTLGNIVGGALMVDAIHWFVYLRPRPAA